MDQDLSIGRRKFNGLKWTRIHFFFAIAGAWRRPMRCGLSKVASTAYPNINLPRARSPLTMSAGENGERVMQDPLSRASRADRYRKEATELSELAESATSSYLRDHYQRAAAQYLLLAEGELRLAKCMGSSAGWAALYERGANGMPVQMTRIKSVEPHPVSEKESHTFECRECGLPRTYTMKLN
jgi:hypothetical protein